MNNSTKIDFKLSFEFTGNYPEQRVKELMYKIADALYHEYSHGNGFAPDDIDECLTDGVRIKYENIHLLDRYYVREEKGQRKTDIIDFSGK